MIRLLIIVLASIFAAANPSPGQAASPEQRCSALGVNCLCSEPLEMTAYVKSASGVDAVWNPNDSTTKQCNGENNYDHGSAINRGDSDPPLIGSDPAVLAAFPADASVPRYFRGSEGHTGTYEFGHVLAASDPRTRVAVRWYVYMSPNYVWTTGKTSGVHCLNSAKWFSLRTDAGASTQWDTTDGANTTPLIYGWTTSVVGWSPQLDCCRFGPRWTFAGQVPAEVASQKVGKWYRYEVVLRRMTTGSTSVILEAYRKNVTDNKAEFKIIDTSIACTGCNSSGRSFDDWGNGGSTTRLKTPNQTQLTRVEPNLFRNDDGAHKCGGWRAYSHMLVAAWSTDAGQRIGPATEIESSGGATMNAPRATPVTPATLGVVLVRNELKAKAR